MTGRPWRATGSPAPREDDDATGRAARCSLDSAGEPPPPSTGHSRPARGAAARGRRRGREQVRRCPSRWTEALAQVRGRLLADDLVRAVGSGRRRGEQPRWRRVELRPVDLRAGRHLQSTAYDSTAGAHPQRRRGSRRRRPGRRAARGPVRQLAPGVGDGHAAAAGHQAGRRAAARVGPPDRHRTGRRDRVGARPGPRPPARPGRRVPGRGRDQLRRRRGQAVPAGQVPPGRSVLPAARRGAAG